MRVLDAGRQFDQINFTKSRSAGPQDHTQALDLEPLGNGEQLVKYAAAGTLPRVVAVRGVVDQRAVLLGFAIHE